MTQFLPRAEIPKRQPTVFPDLNDLLAEVVARVGALLGDNFVGAYLTGSFALGGGDRQSDCDFLVVTQHQVTAEQARQLRQLHDEIPTRDGHWSHDLEGSYAPMADLATPAALGKPWLYVNRGQRELEWSSHCNTEDVRWTLRERGITLAGPDPGQLVAEVPADTLRSAMPPLIESFLPDLFSWTGFDIAWTQRYAVTTLCRMLYTLDTGEVASKHTALEWGKDALDPIWLDLVEQVVNDRPLAWNDAPRAGIVEATIAFAEYAKERARS